MLTLCTNQSDSWQKKNVESNLEYLVDFADVDLMSAVQFVDVDFFAVKKKKAEAHHLKWQQHRQKNIPGKQKWMKYLLK